MGSTAKSSSMTDSASDILLAVLLGGLLLVTGGVWLWGQTAALITHGAWPNVGFWHGLSIARELPPNASNPAGAWPESAQAALPGSAVFYCVGALLLVSELLAAGTIVRAYVARRPVQGFATRRQLGAMLAASAVIKRGAIVRPSLVGARLRVEDVGVRLGRSVPGAIPLAASAEDSVLVMAAPRQGKTSQVVIPWLHQWPGPALVTSIRTDVLLATAPLRRDLGRVAVLAPTGMVEWPDQLAWSATSGCEDFDKARARADVMVVVGKSDKTSDSNDGGFFGLTATNLLAGWLHAAAVSGGGMSDVLRWGFDERLDESVRILRDHPDAAAGTAAMLDNIYRSPADTTRNNLWTTVQTAIAPLLSARAQRTFCPAPEDSADLEELLTSRATVYLMVSKKQANALAPLISAFVDELIETAKRLADASPGGRLDPPLALLLDEVANVAPLPELPDLMSFAGGSGIFTTAVLQSRAQAEARWGREGAAMLWGASTVKVIMGGLSGDELRDISELSGEYQQRQVSRQHGNGGTSTQTSYRDKRTLTPEQIRTLDASRREVLVLHATTPVVKARMIRHYEGPDRSVFASAEREARRLIDSAPTRPTVRLDKEAAA